MRIKYIILSSVLLITGAAALRWSLTEREKEKSLHQQQQEILKAGLAKVENMVASQTVIHPSSDITLSESLQQKLDKYEKRKEIVELVFTASIVCISTGGVLLSCWLLLKMARLFIKIYSSLTKFRANFFRNRKETAFQKVIKARAKQDIKNSEFQKQYPPKNDVPILRCGIADPSKYSPSQLEKQLNILKNSGWNNLNKDYINHQEQNRQQTDVSDVGNHRSCNGDIQFDKAETETHSTKNAEKTALLLSDEESVKLEQSLEPISENNNIDITPFNQVHQNNQQVNLEDFQEESTKPEDLLKTQTENLEKQMAELSAVAKTIQQSSLEHSDPLNDTLAQLTQQIAAIREYAGQQQDRVEKLQEGYDWNIIRNFCLRIIRCIDNVEGRIKQLNKQNIDTTDLKEIRDELIFALESSSIEQFELEINTDYRGQEKIAEAIKDKQHTNNPKLKGKIAKLIRPGYRYIIDQDNTKVIRTAQVKLFD